jgi:Fic family protein
MSTEFDINHKKLTDSLTTALTFETDKLQKILTMIREYLSFADEYTSDQVQIKTELKKFIEYAHQKITNERRNGVNNATQKLFALKIKYNNATVKRNTIEEQIHIIDEVRRELERLTDH